MVNPKTTKLAGKTSKQVRVYKEKKDPLVSNQFPIVGIGASAGGLEAFELFLENVPENSGMAYVMIQHLDPTQKGMLPELLQRVTTMKVLQVKNRMAVMPNCVYVIPPNKSMSISKGMLLLQPPIESRGLRLPIDFFFRSLANDQKDQSVGVILSGMGSDGTIGLCSIKEMNGIVMVQEPDTAKFNSMPRNAIDTLQVDIVGPANELPKKLVDFLKHIPAIKSNIEIDAKEKSAIERIIILLKTHTGNDFSQYKKSTIYRRIERRMGVHKIENINAYVKFLHENANELNILFKELLIGVTNFFRDSNVWDKLEKETIPEIIENLPNGSDLRAWVPACSTGEEAYSLAIIFKEAMKRLNPKKQISLQIFATDLDTNAIDIARKGCFHSNIASDVSHERLDRFFTQTDFGYRINNDIREMVIFAQHNLIMHPPFTKIDILSCRNLLIYMEPELQKKLLGLFYFSINNNGLLMLGSSETLGNLSHLFLPIDPKLKLFKRSVNALQPDMSNFPSSFTKGKAEKFEKPPVENTPHSIQTLADQLLLQNYSPPSVLVNDNGDIVYISGRTGKYLEPASGKANLNIFAMLRDGLRNEFHAGFHQALRKRGTVVLRNLKVGTNGSTQTLNIHIHWVDKPESIKGMVMVVFNDVAIAADVKQKAKTSQKLAAEPNDLENELQNTREEMQSSVEEMQASQEELKSANEELQSANEELQSTNEELTSSKEEMQSLNEELQTVNAELQAKVDESSRMDNDMKNLLNSTDIATLFLDKELNIRQYTIQATKIFKLIRSDIGRPFTDQVADIFYPDMAEDALEVLRTLVYCEKQIPSKDGRWFSIRIMPYRTFDDRIDGLVITFINITQLKQIENRIAENEQYQHILLNQSANIIVKLSTSGEIIEVNSAAQKYFGSKADEILKRNFTKYIFPEAERKKTEKAMQKLLKGLVDGKIKTQVKTAAGKTHSTEWQVKILQNKLNQATGMVLITENNPLN